MLTFEEARRKVIEQVGKMRGPRERATVAVWDALGLVLVQEIKTDREYPPFDRSTRDGYAVRSSEVKPGTQLKCAGEIKAGDSVTEALAPGTCIQIMTGAAVPAGADAVVMIEYTRSEEHTSELQSQSNLVCPLLLEKKKISSQFFSHPPIASFNAVCLVID